MHDAVCTHEGERTCSDGRGHGVVDENAPTLPVTGSVSMSVQNALVQSVSVDSIGTHLMRPPECV
jgi:hypothetical protein